MAAASAYEKTASAETRVAELESALDKVQQQKSADALSMACDNDTRLLATQKANDTAAFVEELNVKVAAQAAQLESAQSDHVTARAQAEEVSRERERLLR